MNMHDNSSLPAGQPEQPEETPASHVPDPFEEFVARARETRALRPVRPDDDLRPWADPDPEAILRLPAGKHPVTAVKARRHGRPESRAAYYRYIRACCARLQGVPTKSITDEDVMVFPWHHVDVDVASEYALGLRIDFDNVDTRNQVMKPLRHIITACAKAGLISASRRDDILEVLPTSRPGPSAKRRRLTDPEIASLLDACTGPSAADNSRDAAVIAVFATTGVRISELADMQYDHWDQGEGLVHLPSTKNGRAHVVFVHQATSAHLHRWIAVRGDWSGPLFQGPDPTQALLRTGDVRAWVDARRRQAAVRRFTPHDFRRTFASTLLRTHDVALVGRLLNQVSPESTLAYDLTTEDEQRNAIATLFLADPPAAPVGEPTEEDPAEES